MNRDQARELLPIIQAFADGKDIQERVRIVIDNEKSRYTWFDTQDYNPSNYYRIKPEPEVIYVNKLYMHKEADIYSKKGQAERAINAIEEYDYAAKKFIEVIE